MSTVYPLPVLSPHARAGKITALILTFGELARMSSVKSCDRAAPRLCPVMSTSDGFSGNRLKTCCCIDADIEPPRVE